MTILLYDPVIIFLVVLRPLGICLIFPVLGSKNLGSALLRNAIILSWALPVLPLYLGESPAININNVGWGFVMQEITIGALIGFAVSLPFWALDSAGFMIDTIRGSSMGSVLNPGLGEAASMLGIFFGQLLIALFFTSGGIYSLLDTLYLSWQVLPPGTPFHFSEQWLELFLSMWHAMLKLCVSFSLPAVIVMVLTDIAIGLINRSAQQLNVFFLAMPIKSAMAIFILIPGMMFAFGSYFSFFEQLPALSGSLFELMKHE